MAPRKVYMRSILLGARIAFRTFALGLAVVWIVNAYDAAEFSPAIQLPPTYASDVLLVHPSDEGEVPNFEDAGDIGCINGIWDPARANPLRGKKDRRK